MIRSERLDRVLLVTIDRDEKRNALDAEHLAALAEVFRDPGDARCLVLAGEGAAFCAGADLGHVEDMASAATVGDTLHALRSLSICTIAAVDGAAMGAGMQLAVTCDLRVVGERGRFGVPAARLGLMIDAWTIERVALLAGHGAARSILLAADTLDADDAWRLGLAQRRGGLEAAVAWAHEIAELAPLSIAGTKLALDTLSRTRTPDPEVDDAFTRVWTSEDRLEGIAAFAERRRPEFRGR